MMMKIIYLQQKLMRHLSSRIVPTYNKVTTLFEDVSDNDSDQSTSILLHSFKQVLIDGPPTIMINETLCGTDNIERLDNPIQVDDNLIVMARRSATTSNDFLPFATTSDNSKMSPKSDHF
jgi:hypothetical protein